MDKIANIDIQMFIPLDDEIFWMNTDFVFQGCNEAFAKTWSLARLNDIKGKTHTHLADARDMHSQCQSFLNDDRQVIETGLPLLNILDPPVPGVEDTIDYYKTNLFPLKNKYSEVIGVFGVSKKITPPKQIYWLDIVNHHIATNSIFSKLTPQEKRVLLRLLSGHPTKSVAAQLNIATRTAETHTENIKRKLNVKSKAELLMLCLKNAFAIV